MKILHGKRTRAKDGETRGSSLFRPRDLGRSGLTSVNARSSNVSSVGKGPLNLADVSSYLVIVIMLSRVITHNGGYRVERARARSRDPSRPISSCLVSSDLISSRLVSSRIAKPVDPVLFARLLLSLHCINYRINSAIGATTF